MINFEWTSASQTLAKFGGDQKEFYIPKTGLPYFDVLRLYGTIDLYIGLQDSVTIRDKGWAWVVKSKVRSHLLSGRVDSAALTLEGGHLSQKQKGSLLLLEAALMGGSWPLTESRNVSEPLDKPDSALQNGIRGTAALTYQGLETGSSKTRSKVAWVDALLAFAGQKRSENVANIHFLPVFKDRVDFSKVVSPLRTWTGIPNVLCAQVITLLALKTSLFAEGYADQLSAVVYNTRLKSGTSERPDNYSGLITIKSTALERQRFLTKDNAKFGRFVSYFYRIFRDLIGRAWKREGRDYTSTAEVEDALAHAYWLLQPNRPKYLSALVTSIERHKRSSRPSIAYDTSENESFVKEIFGMSYGDWKGDYEAVRKFAKTVASGIYYAREVDKDFADRGKVWYDEATMLRSAPSAKAFFERAMILIEQGKRVNTSIGLNSRQEDFDPAQLFKSIGEKPSDFETFRDLFRMYLVQESKPYKQEFPASADDAKNRSEEEQANDELGGQE